MRQYFEIAKLLHPFQRMGRLICAVAILFFLMIGVAEAGIILPATPVPLVDEGAVQDQTSNRWPSLFEVSVDQTTSQAGAGNSQREHFPPQLPDDEKSLQLAVLAGGSASTTSSGSSSSSGASSNSPLLCLLEIAVPEPPLVGWVLAEFRLSLPAPLGNDLLRPPQSA